MKIKVNTKDLTGDLEGFPFEVVEKMLQEQYKQVGKIDIAVFQMGCYYRRIQILV